MKNVLFFSIIYTLSNGLKQLYPFGTCAVKAELFRCCKLFFCHTVLVDTMEHLSKL